MSDTPGDTAHQPAGEATGGQARNPAFSASHSPAPRFCTAWVAMLALAVLVSRLLLIQDPIDVSPDGGEYYGIARHVARGEGYLSSIRWQFATGTSVIHDALPDRQPLWPLLGSLACRLGTSAEDRIWWMRALSGLLAALIVPAGWLLLRPLFAPAATWAVLAAFSFVAPFARYSSQPLADTLYLFLIVVGLASWLRVSGEGQGIRRRPGWAMVAGLAFGLAYLTKPAGLPLALVPIGAAWLPGNRARYGAQAALAGAAGFLLAAAPYWTVVAARYGSPTHSSLWINFSLLHIHEAQHYGFERFLPPPATFIAGHLPQVAAAVVRQAGAMLLGLAEALGPSLLLLPLIRRRDLTAGRGLLGAVVVMNFLAHTLCWAIWGASRYMLVAALAGMALLLAAPLARWSEGWKPGRTVFLVSAAVALAYAGAGFVQLAVEKARPDRGVHSASILREGAARAGDRVAPGGLVATDNPWLVNMLADRPAVILPRTRDSSRLARFFSLYRPQMALIFVDEEPGAPRVPGEPAEWEFARLLAGEPPQAGSRGPLLPAGWAVDYVARGERSGQWLISLRPFGPPRD